MKQFYLIVLSFFFIQAVSATPITAVLNNGSWQAAPTWDKNRKPMDGDTIVIPAGKTILVTNGQTLNNVYLKIYGTVRLTNLFSYLDFNNSSRVLVQTGGRIQATLDYLQYIILGGQTIFWANEINGPVQATGGSNGFGLFNPLPVRFVGFTATKKNNDVLLQWATAMEANAAMYELERSYDGRNWDVIAYISAIGTTSALSQYDYTDKNVKAPAVYYRIRQVDNDGSFTYTDIKVIRQQAETSPGIRIAGSQNKVLLQFPKEIKGNITVQFVNLAGQVVDRQMISNPVGQVVLNAKVSGNYIISLTNGQDLKVARQVIL